MQGRLLAAVLALAMTAGCFGADDAAPSAAAEDDAVAPPPEAEINRSAAPAMIDAPLVESIPIQLDGRTGTQATACVADPVGRCVSHSDGGEESDVVLEGVLGRVTGGTLTLEWTAASPATQRLSFGIMQMDGGDECPGVSLAMARGTSPLTIEVPAAERDLCVGEVVHVWVSGDQWGGVGPTYHQVDVDQAFTLTGTLLVAS